MLHVSLFYGERRFRSLGKSTVFLMFSMLSSVMSSRSNPSPHPECGGIPYLNGLR